MIQFATETQIQNIKEMLATVGYPLDHREEAIDEISDQLREELNRPECNRVQATRKVVLGFIAKWAIDDRHSTPRWLKSSREFAAFLANIADDVYWLDESSQQS